MDQTKNPKRPHIQTMLILLILSPLVRGTALQKTTSSAPRLLPGWVPNACTLVICASPEARPKGEEGDQELESLKRQIMDLKTELEDVKDAINKIQKEFPVPNGVMVNGKIFKTDGSTGNYNTARDICSRMGGALAVPRNAAENSALQKIVTQYNRRAVLGVNDMAKEGRFEYQNGNIIGYSNWVEGEPNNAGNEDCVEMRQDGKWNDSLCTSENLVICEF